MSLKKIVVSDFEDYVGVRGYAKKRAMLYAVGRGQGPAPANIAGYVKAEPILDAEGKLACWAFYAKTPLLGKGQPIYAADLTVLLARLQAKLDEIAAKPAGFEVAADYQGPVLPPGVHFSGSGSMLSGTSIGDVLAGLLAKPQAAEGSQAG